MFQLAGVGVMSTGVYAQLKLQGFSDLTSVKYLTGASLVIAAGACIAFIAFFGCCGAVRESRCLLCIVSMAQKQQKNKTFCNLYGTAQLIRIT